MAGEDETRPPVRSSYTKKKRALVRGSHGLQITDTCPTTPTATIVSTTSPTTTHTDHPYRLYFFYSSSHHHHTDHPTASTSLTALLNTATQTTPPIPPSAPLSTPPDTPHSWLPYPLPYDPVTYPYYSSPYPPPTYHTSYSPLSQPPPRPPTYYTPSQLPLISSSQPPPIQPVPPPQLSLFQSTTHAGPSRPVPLETEAPGQDPAARIYIVPKGDTFKPSLQATHHIRDIIKRKFDGPYVSWKKIPAPVREIWFREFEKYFTWLPIHHNQIRQNFERRGSIRLRDMLSNAQRAGQRPLWIREAIWAELCRQWSTPEFLHLKTKAQQNHSSDCGGIDASLHTGSSIPHTELKRKLKKALERDSTMPELHARMHQRHKTQQWVDRRSEQIQDEYRRVAEQRQTIYAQGETSGSQPKVLDNFATWEQMVGGRVKGQIYGLDSVAQVSPSSHSSYSVDSYINPLKVALEKKVDSLVSKIMQYKQEMREKIELQDSMIVILKAKLDKLKNKKPKLAEPVIDPEGEASIESDKV